MPPLAANEDDPADLSQDFSQVTRWSLVRKASEDDTESRLEALQEICKDYWPPIYAFLRRDGRSQQDAEDLAQGFFCHLLESNLLASADRSVGRLRTFLFACVKNFLGDENRQKNTLKRGGHIQFISLNTGSYADDIPDDLTPDMVYQRSWALYIINRAVEVTRKQFLKNGEDKLFQALKDRLCEMDQHGDVTQAELANSLGMTHGAFRTALFRCRETFRKCLDDEVAQTISSYDPDEIREELRALLESFG